MNKDKLVIGMAGMPGSGKSLVVETAREAGYTAVTMGDVIRDETEERGLAPNSENIGDVMISLRKRGGKSVIADKCIPKVEQEENQKIIVDGLRSLSEVESFKKKFSKFSLLAIHSSPTTRFKRINRRGRSDDPSGWESFCQRDMRELGVGLGGVIAMAEHLLINEGNKLSVSSKTREILRKVEEKWMK